MLRHEVELKPMQACKSLSNLQPKSGRRVFVEPKSDENSEGRSGAIHQENLRGDSLSPSPSPLSLFLSNVPRIYFLILIKRY